MSGPMQGLSQKAFRAFFGKRMAAFEGIPGPPPSLSGNVQELLRRPIWEVLAEYGERYGELCVVWLLGSPTVVVSSPELIWQVLEGDFAHYYKKSPRQELLPLLSNAAELIANGDEWAARRASNPVFLFDDPQRLRAIDTAAIRQAIVQRIQSYGEETRSTPFGDVVPRIMRITFDVLAIEVLGRVLGQEMFEAYMTLAQVGHQRMTPSVPVPFALTPGPKALSLWRSTFESLVQEGRQSPDKVGGLLRGVLQRGSALDERTLATQIGNIFVGGLAPLTSGVINTLHLLARHPEVRERVTTEVRAADARLSGEGVQVLDECPELDRAVLESLRLLAPVPFYPRRTSATEPVTLGGYVLPPDTNVYFTCWGLHRSAAHWEHPERYDPDRWLNGVKEANPPGSGYFFPFGRGRRACAGGLLGMLNIKLTVTSILATCRPEVGAGQDYDATLFFAALFPKGMQARFLPR